MPLQKPEIVQGKISEEHIKYVQKQASPPIIAVVGAKHTTPDYSFEIGLYVGEAVRQWIGIAETGHICTGGSSGVGVDVYQGVIKWCISKDARDEYSRKDGLDYPPKTVPDRFFVLVPEGRQPDEKYTKQRYMQTERQVKPIYAGVTGQERRWYLGNIADVMVVVNGNEGTLEEVLVALSKQRPIITISESGGVARLLGEIKSGHSRGYAQLLDKYGFNPEADNFQYLLKNGSVDPEHIHVVVGRKRREIRKPLRRLLKKLARKT